MNQFILVDPEKCIGCRTCALACSFEHESEFNLVLARIHPLWMSGVGRFFPYTCQQCAEPLCAEACPRGAIRVDSPDRRQDRGRDPLHRLPHLFLRLPLWDSGGPSAKKAYVQMQFVRRNPQWRAGMSAGGPEFGGRG